MGGKRDKKDGPVGGRPNLKIQGGLFLKKKHPRWKGANTAE